MLEAASNYMQMILGLSFSERCSKVVEMQVLSLWKFWSLWLALKVDCWIQLAASSWHRNFQVYQEQQLPDLEAGHSAPDREILWSSW